MFERLRCFFSPKCKYLLSELFLTDVFHKSILGDWWACYNICIWCQIKQWITSKFCYISGKYALYVHVTLKIKHFFNYVRHICFKKLNQLPMQFQSFPVSAFHVSKFTIMWTLDLFEKVKSLLLNNLILNCCCDKSIWLLLHTNIFKLKVHIFTLIGASGKGSVQKDQNFETSQYSVILGWCWGL